ncbi:phosphonate C-P lyase system protein PhnH [Sporosarcina sp. FSL K6-1522]|uniref:phosphonate C-P lyase system protein PhnH n=1 Tax=Sporosarcina sp. FSL K6-1522 TaxID=2921554 RepID=UPI00315AA80C
MIIDVVHDTQAIFRTILHCMSRPGTIESIADIGNQAESQGLCYDSTLLSAMTLLDAEVSFHIIGENVPLIEAFLSAYTLATVAELQEADYVFITNGTNKEVIHNVFSQVKKGTLTNPQQSATIIMETEKLSNDPQLTLRGPGIATTANVQIAASEFWTAKREEANQEYPLGVDMIIVDPQSNMMCLPRTTTIHDCEVS